MKSGTVPKLAAISAYLRGGRRARSVCGRKCMFRVAAGEEGLERREEEAACKGGDWRRRVEGHPRKVQHEAMAM